MRKLVGSRSIIYIINLSCNKVVWICIKYLWHRFIYQIYRIMDMFLYVLWNEHLARPSIPQLTLQTPSFQVWFSIMKGAECFPIQINYWGYDMVNFFYPSFVSLPEVHLYYCSIISLLLKIKGVLCTTKWFMFSRPYVAFAKHIVGT